MLSKIILSASVILGLSAISLPVAAQIVPVSERCPIRAGLAIQAIRNGVCLYTQSANIRTREQLQHVHRLQRQRRIPRTFTPRPERPSVLPWQTKSIDKFEPPKGGAPAETNGAGSRKGK